MLCYKEAIKMFNVFTFFVMCFMAFMILVGLLVHGGKQEDSGDEKKRADNGLERDRNG